MKIISNTEVTSYNLCKRQHSYNYIQGFEPRRYSIPIRRGIAGHSALELYYREMKDGSSVETCKKAALDLLNQEICNAALGEDLDFIQVLDHLKHLIEAYTEVYRIEPFRVLEVEQVHTKEISKGIAYGMKLDLLVEFTQGQYKGDVVLVDHKFSYNFKNEAELALDGQLSKYINTLKDQYFITKGMFNQLRYRSVKNAMPDDVFRRTIIRPTKFEIDEIWREQASAAVEIATQPSPPRRTQSPIVCKNCFFNKMCKADLMGESTADLRTVEYKSLVDRYSDWSGD